METLKNEKIIEKEVENEGMNDQSNKLTKDLSSTTNNFETMTETSSQTSSTTTTTSKIQNKSIESLKSSGTPQEISETIINNNSKSTENVSEEILKKVENIETKENPEKNNPVSNDTSPTNANTTLPRSEVIPDIKELTIKNLDTGEEYIIGENDPDFEFDTFPLTGDIGDGNVSQQETPPWYTSFLEWLFGNNTQPPPPPESVVEKPRFTKLSSFKFRRELGKGAFGRVLLAESKADGKLYALKIISKKNMRHADKRQAMAERDILHAMAHSAPHPFTTGLKFAFQSQNNLYLGMEYLTGGNLKQLIQRFKCLPEDWVRFYAAELILAVSHLHSMQVLYRDIKPHNVMIDSRGHIILIDYGLSKQEVSNPTGAMSLVGTPDYSAPEVLRTGVFRIENEDRIRKGKKPKVPSKEKGEYGYGMAADWWSVGVMIFEMLSGLPTFRGADLRQTYQKVLYADVIFKPEEKFSPPAKELILGLLQRDPSKRLGGAANSPKDIMETSFFDGVNWQDIYNRVNDGPWVPPPPDDRRKGREMTENGLEKDYSDTTSEQSEVINIRDSIIATNNKSDPNRLPDWSFMDETALSSVAKQTNNRYF